MGVVIGVDFRVIPLVPRAPIPLPDRKPASHHQIHNRVELERERIFRLSRLHDHERNLWRKCGSGGRLLPASVSRILSSNCRYQITPSPTAAVLCRCLHLIICQAYHPHSLAPALHYRAVQSSAAAVAAKARPAGECYYSIHRQSGRPSVLRGGQQYAATLTAGCVRNMCRWASVCACVRACLSRPAATKEKPTRPTGVTERSSRGGTGNTAGEHDGEYGRGRQPAHLES